MRATVEQERAVSEKYLKRIRKASLAHDLSYDDEDHLMFFALSLGGGRILNFRSCVKIENDIDSVEFAELSTTGMRYRLSLSSNDLAIVALKNALIARAQELWLAWKKGAGI